MSMFAAGLGLVLGLRHALDPDHVAAVATLMPQGSRHSRLVRGLGLGASWGLGHAAALAGTVALVHALRLEVAGTWSAMFELAVAFMLIGLGARSLYLAWQRGNRGEAQLHRHGGAQHQHPSSAPHWHLPGGAALAWRPFLIGSVHGLAGSGGMMLLLGSRQESSAQLAAFTGAFLLGSVASMALVTALGTFALAALGGIWRRAAMATAGALSMTLGVLWAVPQLATLMA